MTEFARLPSLSRAAERMRLHRERRRRGLRCVTIEVRRSEVDTLIARRLLAPEEQGDGRALRRAIHKLLDVTLWTGLVTRNGVKGQRP
jgi:hypothetical protein